MYIINLLTSFISKTKIINKIYELFNNSQLVKIINFKLKIIIYNLIIFQNNANYYKNIMNTNYLKKVKEKVNLLKKSFIQKEVLVTVIQIYSNL